MRLLILIAGVVFLIFLFRNLLPRRRQQTPDRNTPEKMVSCAWCRLYLPKSEAVPADEQFFCNRDHHAAWFDKQHKQKD